MERRGKSCLKKHPIEGPPSKSLIEGLSSKVVIEESLIEGPESGRGDGMTFQALGCEFVDVEENRVSGRVGNESVYHLFHFRDGRKKVHKIFDYSEYRHSRAARLKAAAKEHPEYRWRIWGWCYQNSYVGYTFYMGELIKERSKHG